MDDIKYIRQVLRKEGHTPMVRTNLADTDLSSRESTTCYARRTRQTHIW